MGNKIRQEQNKDARSPHFLVNTALQVPAVQRSDFSVCRSKYLSERKPQTLYQKHPARANKFKNIGKYKTKSSIYY